MTESTQKLNKVVKEKYSHIPWSEISCFHNKLTHDYLWYRYKHYLGHNNK